MSRMDEILGLIKDVEPEIMQQQRERKQREYVESGAAERHRQWRDENRDYARAYRQKWEEEVGGTTKFLANRTSSPWIYTDDQTLLADDGKSLYQKAVTLGRTYRSVKARLALLRRRGGA